MTLDILINDYPLGFEKYLFKLMNNDVYGKTMENLTITTDYKKYVSKPNLDSQKIFSKHFVAIHEIKSVF